MMKAYGQSGSFIAKVQQFNLAPEMLKVLI